MGKQWINRGLALCLAISLLVGLPVQSYAAGPQPAGVSYTAEDDGTTTPPPQEDPAPPDDSTPGEEPPEAPDEPDIEPEPPEGPEEPGEEPPPPEESEPEPDGEAETGEEIETQAVAQQANSQDTLVAAISAINTSGESEGIITLIGSFEISSAVSFANGKTITLKSDGTKRTISRADGYTGALLSVGHCNLKLENVAFDGRGVEATSALLVTTAGRSASQMAVLEVGDGVVMENAVNKYVSGNSSSGNGGAIFIYTYSRLLIEGAATFRNNTGHQGGAVYGSGIIRATQSGTPTFTGNHAIANGGAVYATTMEIDGINASGNTATNMGGAVYASGALTLVSGSITGNTARSGGGLYTTTEFTMYGGEVSGNAAISTPEEPARLIQKASGGGIAIYGSYITANLLGGEIKNNTVYHDYTYQSSSTSSTRYVGGDGGGVHFYSSGGTLTLGNVSITGNTARSNGGGIHVDYGSAAVQGAPVITGNTASYGGQVYCYYFYIGGKATIGTRGQEETGGLLGCVYFDVDNPPLDGTSIVMEPNYGTDSDPAKMLSFTCGAMSNSSAIPDSYLGFFSTPASYSLARTDSGTKLKIKNAPNASGGLQARIFAAADAAESGEEVVVELTVDEIINRPLLATKSDGTVVSLKLVGSGGTRTLTRADGFYGHLFYFYLSYGAGNNLTLENIMVNGNKGQAQDTESLIYFLGNGTSTLILGSGAKLVNNHAILHGGAVYIAAGRMVMNGGEITGNHANGAGGGIYASSNSGTSHFLGGRVAGNTAGGNGKDLFAGGTPLLGGTAVVGTPGAGGVYLSTSGPVKARVDSGDLAPTTGAQFVMETTVGMVYGNEMATRYNSNELLDESVLPYFQSADPAHSFTINGTGTAILWQAEPEAGSLQALIYNAANNGTITLSSDITLTDYISVKTRGGAAKSVTITSQNPASPVKIMRGAGFEDDLIKVVQGSGLTLKDVIIDGNKEEVPTAAGTLIRNEGALVLDDGAILRNNSYTKHTSSYGYAYGGAVVNGNASTSGATFEMRGGEIRGNHAEQGGAIYNYAPGTYDRTDGSGTCAFVMSGGTIAGNNATNYGGAIYNNNYATINLTGGVVGGATEADANTAALSGGGIHNNGFVTSVLLLNGGAVTGNTAKDGGGIYTSGYCFIRLNSGEISGNTATQAGGGIFIGTAYNSKSVVLDGVVISGNTAHQSGGGVYGYFTMNSGTITGNTATGTNTVTLNSIPSGTGGGVAAGYSIYDSLSFYGGKITGNTAAQFGADVCLYGASPVFGGTPKIGSGTPGVDAVGLYYNRSTVSGAYGRIDLDNRLSGSARIIVEKDAVSVPGYRFIYTSTSTADITDQQSYFTSADPDYTFGFKGTDTQEMIWRGNASSPSGSLQAAVFAASGGGTITLTRDHVLDSILTIQTADGDPHSVTIKGAGAGKDTLSRAARFAKDMVQVPAGGTLTLSGVTLNSAPNGVTGSGSHAILNQGTLHLAGGSKLTGHIGNSPNSSNTNYPVLRNEGVATIADTEISGNTQQSSVVYNYGTTANIVLTLNSGTVIKNNAGQGVLNTATLVMNDGAEISGNTYSGYGAGIENRGTFTMNGGAITGNTTTGGGAGLYHTGKMFTMNGGAITGNTGGYHGAGVQIYAAPAAIYGGEISGNIWADPDRTDVYGQDLYLYNSGTVNTLVLGGTAKIGTAGQGGLYLAYSTSYAVLDPEKPLQSGAAIYIEPLETSNPARALVTMLDNTTDIPEGQRGYFHSASERYDIRTWPDDFTKLVMVELPEEGTLQYLVYNAPVVDGVITVTLTEDMEVAETTYIHDIFHQAVNLRLTSGEGGPFVLSRAFKVGAVMFRVAPGSTFVVDNIHVNGEYKTDATYKAGGASIVENYGDTTFADGSKFYGLMTTDHYGAIVDNFGTFTLDGGEITGNTLWAYIIENQPYTSSRYFYSPKPTEDISVANIVSGKIHENLSGAGVITAYGKEVNMSGGEIVWNESAAHPNIGVEGGGSTATGVFLYRGTFNMSGGTIAYNYCGRGSSDWEGSAVYVGAASGSTRGTPTFNMTGGTINHNQSGIGAGLYLAGAANITGGSITHNYPHWGYDDRGPDVYMSSTAALSVGGTAVIGNTLSEDYPLSGITFNKNAKFHIVPDNPLTTGAYIRFAQPYVPSLGNTIVTMKEGGDVPDGQGQYFDCGPGISLLPEGEDKTRLKWAGNPASGSLNELVYNAATSTEEAVEVVINQDYVLDTPLQIATPFGANKHIKIKSGPGGPYTISRADGLGENMLWIPSGSTLELENVILDAFDTGVRDEVCYGFARVKGTLVLREGAVLTGMHNDYMYGNTYITPLYIESTGTVRMEGGSITGNNSMYGIMLYGTMQLNSGTITGNDMGHSNGIIEVMQGGSLYMNGGSITENICSAAVINEGYFEMNAGRIADHGFRYSNAGIRGVTNEATFKMTGGEIANNAAGGVYSAGTFYGTPSITMTGGTITGNTSNQGGGVYVNNGHFVMTGGAVTGNTATTTAADKGQDVYICSSATLTIGGEISIGSEGAGGVYLDGPSAKIDGDEPLRGDAYIRLEVPTTITGNLSVVTMLATAAKLPAGQEDYFHSALPEYELYFDGGDRVALKWRVVVVEGSLQSLIYSATRNAQNVYEVVLEQDYIVTSTARIGTINSGSYESCAMRISSKDGASYTISRGAGFTGALLEVPYSSTLTLENVTLDGNKDNVTANAPLVHSLGFLTVGSGAVLRNNHNTGDGGAVASVPRFTMSGGTITGNVADGNGGGVYLSLNSNAGYTNSSITGSGTRIENNRAGVSGGGVYATKAITVSNAGVTGNTAATGTDICHDSTGYSVTLSGAPVIGTPGIGGLYSNQAVTLTSYEGLSAGAQIVMEPPQGVIDGYVAVRNSNYNITDACLGYFQSVGSSYALVRRATNLKAIVWTADPEEALNPLQVLIYNATPGEDGISEVKLSSALSIGETIRIQERDGSPKAVRLTSQSGAVQLTRGGGFTGTLFEVPTGSSLTLGKVTLDGAIGAGASAPMVKNSGTLTVTEGATLRNNKAEAADGGAIYNTGALSLAGGSITGNTARFGGAVYNAEAGSATFGGVSITGNTAAAGGGVYNAGTLSIDGASIRSNSLSDASGLGRQVYGGGNVSVCGSAILGSSVSTGGLYLPGGKTLSVNAALTSSASVIMESMTGVAAGTIVAQGSGGYTLTASDAAAFKASGISFSLDSGQNAVVVSTGSATGKVILSYDLNGAAGTPPTAAQHDRNSPATVADIGVTRPWYGFTGWNTRPDGSGTRYLPGGTIAMSDNITLYAQWQGQSIPIRYTLGYHHPADGDENNPASYVAGVGISALNPPLGTRPSHVFDGWYLDGTRVTAIGGDVLPASGADALELVAKWTPDPEAGYIPVESVSISGATATDILPIGGTLELAATVLPENASDKQVAWASSAPSVISVNEQGLVTARKSGTATITASVLDLGEDNKPISGSITLRVNDSGELTFENAKGEAVRELRMQPGNTEDLLSMLRLSGHTVGDASFASSKKAVAGVDASSGRLTAVKAGEAHITATVEQEGRTLTAKLAVLVVTEAKSSASVSISKPNYSVNFGSSVKLAATTSPSNAVLLAKTWAIESQTPQTGSAATQLATIDQTGKLTALNPGTVEVSCTIRTVDGATDTDTCTVTISQPVAAVEIDQAGGELLLAANDGFTTAGLLTLTATVLPANATNRAVTWSSNKKAVATVDAATGQVTGHAPGTAKITVKTDNGKKTASVNVKVVNAVDSITLSKGGTPGKIARGASELMLAEPAGYQGVTPTNRDVLWTSSDESVATIDGDGNVTGLRPGHAVIVATAADGCPGVSSEYALQVVHPLTAVSIDQRDFTFKVTVSARLTATLNGGEGAHDVEYSWSSDNPAILISDDKSASPTLSATAEGTATITLTAKSTGYAQQTASIRVTAATGITTVTDLAFTNAGNAPTPAKPLWVGESGKDSFTPQVSMAPSAPSDPNILWTLSEGAEQYVQLDSRTGAVTALNPSVVADRSVEITVTGTSQSAPDKAVSYTFTTRRKATGIKATARQTTAGTGKPVRVEVAFTPANASERELSVSFVDKKGVLGSSPASQVTYDRETGTYLVSGVKSGTAEIIFKTTDGSEKTSSVKLTFTLRTSSFSIAYPKNKAGEEITTVNKGKTITLKPVFNEGLSTPKNKKVKWLSLTPAIASVGSSTGKVKGLRDGVAVIQGTTADGGYTDTIEVRVNVSVTKVAAGQSAFTMESGKTADISAYTTPYFEELSAGNRQITWSVGASTLAQIYDPADKTYKSEVKTDGLQSVTLKAADGATGKVTLTIRSGSKSAKLKVTIKATANPVTGLSMGKSATWVKVGKSETLKATVLPASPKAVKAANRNVIWRITAATDAAGNPVENTAGIATISRTGKVTAKAAGKVIVVATTSDGGFAGMCEVNCMSKK